MLSGSFAQLCSSARLTVHALLEHLRLLPLQSLVVADLLRLDERRLRLLHRRCCSHDATRRCAGEGIHRGGSANATREYPGTAVHGSALANMGSPRQAREVGHAIATEWTVVRPRRIKRRHRATAARFKIGIT